MIVNDYALTELEKYDRFWEWYHTFTFRHFADQIGEELGCQPVKVRRDEIPTFFDLTMERICSDSGSFCNHLQDVLWNTQRPTVTLRDEDRSEYDTGEKI